MSEQPDVVEAQPQAPGARPKSRIWRTVVASVLGVLAVALIGVAVVGVWARATVLRAEPVASLSVDAIEQPEVQTALATYLADEIQDAVDLEARLDERLPSNLQQFAGPIAAGAHAAVERVLARALATPEVQDAVRIVIERAHTRAMRILEGDGIADGLSVEQGEVSVNLLPLVSRGLTALQSMGLLGNIDVPELTADGDPDEQVAQLSEALGRDLPAGAGQLVVWRSERIADAQETVQTAQRILAVSQRGVWLVIVLAIVLLAATLLVATGRWRATLVLALATAAFMVILRAATREVVTGAVDLARRPGGKAAIDAIVGGAMQGLRRVAGAVLIVALLVTAVAVARRRQWRGDLVLVGAVLLGAFTVALVGLTVAGVVLGVVVAAAVPIAAHWLIPEPSGRGDLQPS